MSSLRRKTLYYGGAPTTKKNDNTPRAKIQKIIKCKILDIPTIFLNWKEVALINTMKSKANLLLKLWYASICKNDKQTNKQVHVKLREKKNKLNFNSVRFY